MIEQGIVMLVQGDDAVKAMCAGGVGGYFATLPKDQAKPTWSYTNVSFVPNRTLRGRNQSTMRRLQVDVYGDPDGGGADCITLAGAIASVLDGFAGALPDPEGTVVQAIFLDDLTDFFDDTARSYRRMLEFAVHFNDVTAANA